MPVPSHKSSSQVLGACDDLHVQWIHAAIYTTQVVQLEFIGDWADMVDVKDLVGIPGAVDSPRGLSVAVPKQGTKPQPAPGFLVKPEATQVLKGDGLTAGSPCSGPPVMTFTHAKPETVWPWSAVPSVDQETGHGEIVAKEVCLG